MSQSFLLGCYLSSYLLVNLVGFGYGGEQASSGTHAVKRATAVLMSTEGLRAVGIGWLFLFVGVHIMLDLRPSLRGPDQAPMLSPMRSPRADKRRSSSHSSLVPPVARASVWACELSAE